LIGFRESFRSLSLLLNDNLQLLGRFSRLTDKLFVGQQSINEIIRFFCYSVCGLFQSFLSVFQRRGLNHLS